MKNTVIRSASLPKCSFCENAGVHLYRNITDRLFGGPGQWNFRKCKNRECGAIWLDPMPLKEDIWKGYINYYTHEDTSSPADTKVKRIFQMLKDGYYARKYGYFNQTTASWQKLLSILIYLYPVKSASLDSSVMFLSAKPGGLLLDVGCGNGDRLFLLKSLGWEVEGVDFDQSAVDVALSKGLLVYTGELEAQQFSENRYDAIILHHLIEHVYEPVQLLQECYRIMKPGASLVAITPNNSSLSHRIFTKDWRGLEPPRHLHIFNRNILERVAIESGFEIVSSRTILTSIAPIIQSYELKTIGKIAFRSIRQNVVEYIIVMALTIIESIMLLFNNNIGENAVIIAKKSTH